MLFYSTYFFHYNYSVIISYVLSTMLDTGNKAVSKTDGVPFLAEFRVQSRQKKKSCKSEFNNSCDKFHKEKIPHVIRGSNTGVSDKTSLRDVHLNQQFLTHSFIFIPSISSIFLINCIHMNLIF